MRIDLAVVPVRKAIEMHVALHDATQLRLIVHLNVVFRNMWRVSSNSTPLQKCSRQSTVLPSTTALNMIMLARGTRHGGLTFPIHDPVHRRGGGGGRLHHNPTDPFCWRAHLSDLLRFSLHFGKLMWMLCGQQPFGHFGHVRVAVFLLFSAVVSLFQAAVLLLFSAILAMFKSDEDTSHPKMDKLVKIFKMRQGQNGRK